MLTSCEEQTKELTLEFVSDPISSDHTAVHTCKVTWNNEIFETEPEEFSPQLAKLSMVLSASAYSSDTLLNNLKALGFEKNAKWGYGENYDPTATGIVMASRKTGGTTVMCVVIRGTYQNEWYSNFDIGKSIEHTKVHSGFDTATEFAMKKLEMYLVNYGIDRDHTKFIITGHSRGGAVANLMSARLIDKYGKENVYGYTFASPNTTTSTDTDDKQYSGIFNFVNPTDFIAFVPPEKWGFSKYGTTIAFAQNGDELYNSELESVKAEFTDLTSREYKGFDSTEKLNDFLLNIYELCPTVDDYYNKKFDVVGGKMSVYEYMMTVAKLLNDEDVITNGLTMFSTASSELSGLTDFFTGGMDAESASFSIDYENSLIAYAHTCETYIAWLDAYISDL